MALSNKLPSTSDGMIALWDHSLAVKKGLKARTHKHTHSITHSAVCVNCCACLSVCIRGPSSLHNSSALGRRENKHKVKCMIFGPPLTSTKSRIYQKERQTTHRGINNPAVCSLKDVKCTNTHTHVEQAAARM